MRYGILAVGLFALTGLGACSQGGNDPEPAVGTVTAALASAATPPNFRIYNASFENSAKVVPPGAAACPNGALVTSLGQGDRALLFRPLVTATGAIETNPAATIRNPYPTPATVAVGTDNQMTRLPDGSLLAEKDSAEWTPMNPAPSWANEIVSGGGVAQAGNRGNPTFYRSTDCGQNWQYWSSADFGVLSGGIYGVPRPGNFNSAGNLVSDVPCSAQQNYPGTMNRAWWIGGMDRTEVYSCPFTNNLYMTTRVISGPYCTGPGDTRGMDKNTALLLFSSDLGKNWQVLVELPASSPLVMTSTPNGRLFLFQNNGFLDANNRFVGQPTLYYSQPLAAGEKPVLQGPPSCPNCGYPVFAPDQNGNPISNDGPVSVDFFQQVGFPTMSRISLDRTTSKVRIAYSTRNGSGNMSNTVARVEVGADGGQPLVKTVATVNAEDAANHSVMYMNFVEPDYLDLPSSVRSNSAMGYWVEAPRCRNGELYGGQPDGDTNPFNNLSCGNSCVNTQTNAAHCGACQNACATGQFCSGGACVVACAAGQTQCGTSCVTVATDARNCGFCGNSCAFNETCSAGACVSDGTGRTNYGVRHDFFEGDCRATTPRYLSVKNDHSPRTWRQNLAIGDYMTSGGWYDGKLNYLAHWSEPFEDATFQGGLMAATTVTPFGPSSSDRHVWNAGRLQADFVSYDNLARGDGWQTKDLGSHVLDSGEVRIDGVWHHQTTPTGWVQGHTVADFEAAFNTFTAAGFRLETLSSFVLGDGGVRVDALWQSNPNVSSSWIQGFTVADFVAENTTRTGAGAVLDHMQSFVLADGGVRVDAVWHDGPGTWSFAQGFTVADFIAQDNTLRSSGWRLDELSSFVLSDGAVRVDAVWHTGPEQSFWVQGYALEDFRSIESDLRCQGWQLTKMNSFVLNGGGVRVDGVWHRQATPPPTALCQDVTVSAGAACTGTITPQMVDNGSFTPSGTPPALTLSSTGPFPRGPSTVTLTASSGGLSSTCTARVTVVDATPPIVTPPANVTTSQCLGSASVTVGRATATDNCGGTPSIVGEVIASNGLPVSPPVVIAGTQVNLGIGTHTIRWTASDGTNQATANQTVTVGPRIEAGSSFIVEDRARVQNTSGVLAAISNAGSGLTQVRYDARSGGIYSVGRVEVFDRATIGGAILSASTIQVSSTASVSGAQNQFASIVLPALPTLPSFPPVNSGSVTVNSGSMTRGPGSYDNVTLNGGTLVFSPAGDFFVKSLTINSSTTFRVAPNSRIFVQNQVAYRSPFLALSGTALQSVYFGFAGTSVTMEAPFNGTFLAPSATAAFGTGSGLTFTGSFFASTIQVRPGSILVCL
jgi:hypothetical protein